VTNVPYEMHRDGAFHPDRVIATLGEAQHNMVGRHQLAALGVTRRHIDARVRSGHLHRFLPGVYSVGTSKVSQRGRWMGTVLAAGEGTVLSHGSAAALRGLGPDRMRVAITVPTDRARHLKPHVSKLEPDEITVHDGIPVTTVARTLLDLAAVVPQDQLERAVREAEVRGLADATPLPVLLERHRGRKGTKALLAVMPRANDGRTKSELEEAFLRFLDARGLPRPKLNRHVAGKERDCVYADQRLVIELDGWWSHGKARFHADRGRDRRLLVAGFTTVRVTFDHVENEADDLEADLRALLGSTFGVHVQA
jgi:very-short-patch-repair endonuclease